MSNYRPTARELLEFQKSEDMDAINIPNEGDEPNEIEPNIDDSKPRRKPRKRTWRQYFQKNADAGARDFHGGWKGIWKSKRMEDSARALRASREAKAYSSYRDKSKKANAMFRGELGRMALGGLRAAFPLFEEQLIEMGITNYDLDNYDYFLAEGKKKSGIFKKLKKAVGKQLKRFDNYAKKRQMSGIVKNKKKGDEHKREMKKKVKKGAAIAEALLEHSEYMGTSADGSPNMVELVRAAMNGEPATTQDLFKNAMAEKLAVALDAYRQVAAQDMFNDEPSDADYEDFEDAELVAEWVDGPEDEDDFPDDDGFDEDELIERSIDDMSDEELEDEIDKSRSFHQNDSVGNALARNYEARPSVQARRLEQAKNYRQIRASYKRKNFEENPDADKVMAQRFRDENENWRSMTPLAVSRSRNYTFPN